jgi:hypothetical protein
MSGRKAILTAAVVLALGAARVARAADVPPPYSCAPAALAAGPCASQGCTNTGLTRFTASCRGVNSACANSSCETSRFPMHKKEPYVVNLCPGGCFGHFQTQWRKWDEVCPVQGVVEVMPPPIPPLPPSSDRTPVDKKKNGDGLPPPRVIDPKIGMPIPPPPPPGVGTLPAVPLYPGLGSRY